MRRQVAVPVGRGETTSGAGKHDSCLDLDTDAIIHTDFGVSSKTPTPGTASAFRVNKVSSAPLLLPSNHTSSHRSGPSKRGSLSSVRRKSNGWLDLWLCVGDAGEHHIHLTFSFNIHKRTVLNSPP
ncbi:hypothetical protein ZHAS_00018725 [Anopheles sinensis]|uniref:Uncharacterized protein n=1 Tax=Anopheles sinensis TaxID=74873 RepID=A0A084WKE3_ANOSI|nr:hypothetical protein ZHAS_00018725 [Anopheles sinensis]